MPARTRSTRSLSLLQIAAASAITCTVVTIPLAAIAADDDVPSVDEARRQVIDRLAKLQNIVVEYEQTDTL